MSPPSLRLLPARSWGRVRYYPLCELSHFICALRGRKVFVDADLAVARLFGYDVILEAANGLGSDPATRSIDKPQAASTGANAQEATTTIEYPTKSKL